MKITLSQSLLNQSLTYTQKAIANKPQLPVLSGILFKAEKDSCQILATDLYLGIKTMIPAQVSQKGSAVIPGRQLKELVSMLDESEVTIETQENSVTIKSGGSTTTLSLLPLADFPDFPSVEGEEVILSQQLLQQISQKVMPAVSNDTTRPVLTCVLFDINKKNAQVVATDGFRLSLLKSSDVYSPNQQQWLIPANALSEVIRVAQAKSEKSVTVCAAPDIKQVRFSVADVQFWVRLMDGEYPPYTKIIPSDFKTQIQMSASELLSHVRRAQVVTKDTSNIVEFRTASSKLSIVARTTTVSSYTAEPVTEKVTGDDCAIAFNARYLIDILKDGGDAQIKLSLVEGLKPAQLTFLDQSDFLYVMMPFRING